MLRRVVAGTRRHRAALVGDSPAIAALRSSVERVAVVDSTVLLQGESGTGKELVARELHALARAATGRLCR